MNLIYQRSLHAIHNKLPKMRLLMSKDNLFDVRLYALMHSSLTSRLKHSTLFLSFCHLKCHDDRFPWRSWQVGSCGCVWSQILFRGQMGNTIPYSDSIISSGRGSWILHSYLLYQLHLFRITVSALCHCGIEMQIPQFIVQILYW